MTRTSRQLALLALLLVVFGFLLTRQLGSGPEAAAAFGGDSDGRRSQGAALGGAEREVVDLQLAALDLKPGQYSPGRDPFRFQARVAPPPPRPRPRPQPRPQPAKEVERPQQAPVRRPPPIDFVYLGSFGPKSGKIGVFSDQRDIYNAAEGQVLKEKFVVRGIGFESADVGFVEFPEVPVQRLAAGG